MGILFIYVVSKVLEKINDSSTYFYKDYIKIIDELMKNKLDDKLKPERTV